MTIWPPDRTRLSRPAHRALAQALMRAIEAGEVNPGDRLPTHRELAFRLGVSVPLTRDLDPASIARSRHYRALHEPTGLPAATRTSPLDGRNLNRIFPGKPDGSPTEKIADYFNETLAPDYVLDFHSGGKTLDFIPFARPPPRIGIQEDACIAAMHPLNALYIAVLLEIDNVGMFDTAVEALGRVFVSTELGGGGTATARSIDIERKGARNFLIHAGILTGEPEGGPTVELDMPDVDCFVFSEHDGLIEPLVDLGQPVERGQIVARVWPVERSGVDPIANAARRSPRRSPLSWPRQDRRLPRRDRRADLTAEPEPTRVREGPP